MNIEYDRRKVTKQNIYWNSPWETYETHTQVYMAIFCLISVYSWTGSDLCAERGLVPTSGCLKENRPISKLVTNELNHE